MLLQGTPGRIARALAAMPAGIRHDIGLELMRVQFSGEPPDFNSMATVGTGVYEIRVGASSGAYRSGNAAKFEAAVFVLHAFQRKTQRTAKADFKPGKARYRMIGGKP